MAYIKRKVTTELPTALNYLEEVYYQDENGVLTLWVGREDGSAWPAVGYKEFSFGLLVGSSGSPILTQIKNEFGGGTLTAHTLISGSYEIRWPSNLDATLFGGESISNAYSTESTVANTICGFARGGAPYSLVLLKMYGFNGSLIGPSGPPFDIYGCVRLFPA